MSLPRLTRQDGNWPGTKLWLEEKLAEHRAVLEQQGVDQATTEYTRGCIAQLKALIHEIDPPARA